MLMPALIAFGHFVAFFALAAALVLVMAMPAPPYAWAQDKGAASKTQTKAATPAPNGIRGISIRFRRPK